jgi:hypothetical protein
MYLLPVFIFWADTSLQELHPVPILHKWAMQGDSVLKF